MVSHKEVQVWLILADPDSARDYIRTFDFGVPANLRPTEITTNTGRTINFHTMTDEDAVVAAMELLRTIEIPLVMNEKQFHDEH